MNSSLFIIFLILASGSVCIFQFSVASEETWEYKRKKISRSRMLRTSHLSKPKVANSLAYLGRCSRYPGWIQSTSPLILHPFPVLVHALTTFGCCHCFALIVVTIHGDISVACFEIQRHISIEEGGDGSQPQVRGQNCKVCEVSF